MPSESRSNARKRAAELHRREQERAKRRRRINTIVGVVVAVAVIGGLVLIGLTAGGGSESSDPPKNLVDGAIVTGKPDAKATVTLYEDLQCPACRNFEQTTGPTLQKLVDDGTVRLERRPVAFLDRFSTTNYSTRSLNAVACVLDTTPKVVPKYMSALFAQQPAEGGDGLPDEKLVSIAKDNGAGDIGSCVKDKTFAGWTKAMSASASESKIDRTPTVLVNGTPLDNPSPEALTQAVAEAGNTATPSPSTPPAP